MNVILLGNRVLRKLKLPAKVEGSFFLTHPVTDENLVNIDASNNEWIIHGNELVQLSDIHGNLLSSAVVKPNEMFIISYENQQKIIYCCDIYDGTTNTYQVRSDCELIVGKQEDCNIIYNNPFIQSKHMTLKYSNGVWSLSIVPNSFVYVNDRLILAESITLKNSDFIFVFGLKILIMNNFIVINNINNSVVIKTDKLMPINYFDQDMAEQAQVAEEEEIKEEDLYKDSDYFFKTPRLRRFVETFELNVANPPGKQEQEEMPLLLTVGPMVTMALLSVMTSITSVTKIISGETTFAESWQSLVTPAIMLLTSLLWPNITRVWQKKSKKRKEKNRQEKYREYIAEKKKLIESETINQTTILNESFISPRDCYNIIVNRDRTLWERKISQKDFLTVRLGVGDRPIDMNVTYSEEDFSIEKDVLKDEASSMIENTKMLHQVPISYSFFDKTATAVMGNLERVRPFVNNLILQFITFHSYDELKIVIFTDEANQDEWKIYKELPYLFSNDKQMRFFATNEEERKNVSNYLEQEFINRANASKEVEIVENESEKQTFSPYYLIITDDYVKIRKLGICEKIFDVNDNFGFGFIILENRLSHLPSKCVDFITIDEHTCGVLKNDADDYSLQSFNSEIDPTIDMEKCVEVLSNIPIEFEENTSYLPNSLSFLEMYNVGKVEQLNIMNRWKLNDPTKSLKAPIGVNDQGNMIILDLHEKYHGPHGLIAGTTGSGKSEFIITYILSMAVNYNPNEVSFILIDYKGGGLAGAFENKKNNVRLPHLAGTITNLDKNELNRTLVSIQSELKRRQSVFNSARDELGESTIDIYKYQKFFREGKLKEPMPHLFIICDEFAELKTQQPEFMDNLISAARIGRSLGVHLILATQKPSGVVNDQIWSNTKFRVCLKVAETSDSNEIIKCPDAAGIKNAGRFYLQVGYNEIFVLGQSGWCGAPYMPSDIVKKEYDHSISIIDNIGNVVKNCSPDSNKKKVAAEGDELSNILQYVTLLAQREDLKARNLWLDSIPFDLPLQTVVEKYQFTSPTVTAVLGEYDDPTNQYQNILTLPLNEEGNTMIYGLSGSNREMFLRTLIYSVCNNYSSDDINFYLLDFGSESFKVFSSLPHVGDVVLSAETEKIDKLFKMIDKEILDRKKLFADYNGEYSNYCKNSGKKVPLIAVIINNLESFKEFYPNYDELLLKLSREGKRCGVIFIMATSGQSGLFSRFLKNFDHEFVLDMNSKDDYSSILGKIGNVYPADTPGRGLFKGEQVYEFQTASICDEDMIVEFIKEKASELSKTNPHAAKAIPVLPDVITLDMLKDQLVDLKSIPIGIIKETLNPALYNFKSDKATVVSSNDIESCKEFVGNLLQSFKILKDTVSIVFDAEQLCGDFQSFASAYCDDDWENFIDKITKYVDEKINNTACNAIFVIFGVEKFKTTIGDEKFEALIGQIQKVENCNVLIVDSAYKLKKFIFDPWYTGLVVNTNGVWIGSGVTEQTAIKANDYNKKYSAVIDEHYGWLFKNGNGTLIKLIGGSESEEQDFN